MGLVDWLMERWARAERRRDACQWCRERPRLPGSAFCSDACDLAAGDAQAMTP